MTSPAVALHREVVLAVDVPEEGLRRGDLGTVVHVYPDEAGRTAAYEVEFFMATGTTRTVVTLKADDVRPLDERDVVTVRSLGQTG